MLEDFSQWLAGTSASYFVQDVAWIIPLTQTIHILAIAIVMFAIGTLNLRLMGIAGRNQSFSGMVNHFMPWIWVALVVLLLSGSILTIGEPARQLLNDAFRLKMLMVVTVVLLMFAVQRATRKDAHYWEVTSGRRWAARLIALVSLCLWVSIVVAGRLIAYMDSSQMG
jgi:hypothetical protein